MLQSAYLVFDAPSRLGRVERSYRLLGEFMASFVKDRKAAFSATGDADGRDLFTCLVQASESDDKLGLSDQELVSIS